MKGDKSTKVTHSALAWKILKGKGQFMKYLVEWYEEVSNLYRKEIEAESKEDAIDIANNICIEPISSEISDFEIQTVYEIKD